jgi:RNA polymerase sigma-70 factor (ECF subfamily)
MEPAIRAHDRREEAIPRILQRHGEQLYRIALSNCRNHHDAEDLVQETMLLAYRNWEQFDGTSSVMTWLYRIAARRCMRMRRRKSGEPAHLESLEELVPFGEERMPLLPAGALDPSEHSARADMHELVERAIVALPTAFRLPLILKDIFNVAIADIAAVLELKPDTVKSRLHRARLRLQRAIVKELPSGPGKAPLYAKSICLDLLRTKQDALDRGVPFPVGNDVMCERCRSVFSALDLAQYACRDLARRDLPAEVRTRLAAMTGESTPAG